MSVKFRELLYERSVKGSETIKKQHDEPKVTIFDILNQIWTKKEKHPYDKKIASAWMLTSWIAQDPELIEYAQTVNKMQFNMTDEQVYKYYLLNIPKTRKRYIGWTRKDAVSLKREKKLEKLMVKYDVSNREAMMILRHKERLQNGRN